MSQTSHEPQRTSSGKDEAIAAVRAPLPTPARPSTSMQGWAYFGAAIMALMGLFWAVLGVIALVDDEYFTVRSNGLLALHTYSAWGWAHLLGGLLALAAGVGILWGGHLWARVAGIVVAALSAVVNLGFLAASPLWAVTLIGLDIVVIFALTVHGWEIDER